MLDFTLDGLSAAVSIRSDHGLLHGKLALSPTSPGIIVLAHVALAQDAKDEWLASQFRHAGFSTFSVDLLTRHEEHYPDVHNNIPLLTKRLVDFLGALKNSMTTAELRAQPLGLFAANATSPVALRVAALRDHDIAAVVCRGGLIDLAGMLYLHSLESPLLMLVEETDEPHLASNRRAFQEIACRKEFKTIPEIGFDYAASAGIATCVQETTVWFSRYFTHHESSI